MLPTHSSEIASRFARVALGHVTREYPNKLDHVIAGPGDVLGPRALHPVFYGSFDWHSCIHGHWLLARLHRRYPDLPEAHEIRTLLDAQFTAAKIAGEVAYLSQPGSRGFERPYGWAWALMLEGELLRHQSEDGARWAQMVQPLADAFIKRFEDFLPLTSYPVRAGVHSNTAFALLLALDYAEASGNCDFAALCHQTARNWYGEDRDCQAWEPSQDEFLSPALIEAALMRQVFSPQEFSEWFAVFLPDAARGSPRTLFEPAIVGDRSDGKIAHLDGLNLSRAWCWRLIATGLAAADPLHARVSEAVAHHIECALPHIAGDYMGEHWLASFATLALDPDST